MLYDMTSLASAFNSNKFCFVKRACNWASYIVAKQAFLDLLAIMTIDFFE